MFADTNARAQHLESRWFGSLARNWHRFALMRHRFFAIGVSCRFAIRAIDPEFSDELQEVVFAST
jgi:hypothetical protein